MQDKITEIHQQIADFTIENKEQLETFRIAYVGRKGVIGDLFDELKNVPQEENIGLRFSSVLEQAYAQNNGYDTVNEPVIVIKHSRHAGD